MPEYSFVQSYLRRRRELETDRIAKEQFDREIADREAARRQNAEYQQALLTEQQQARAARAKEFTAQLDQQKEQFEQGQKNQLIQMFAEGVAAPPKEVSPPLALTGPASKLPGPGSVEVPGQNIQELAGQRFAMVPPIERKITEIQATDEAMQEIEENRKQRRLADFDTLYQTKQISEPQYNMAKMFVASGGQILPKFSNAEELWTHAQQMLMSDPENPKWRRLAETSKKMLEDVYQMRSQQNVPYSAGQDSEAITRMSQHISALAQAKGFSPNSDIPPDAWQAIRDEAFASAMVSSDPLLLRGARLFQSTMTGRDEETDPIKQYVNEQLKRAFDQLRQKQGQEQGQEQVVAPGSPSATPAPATPSPAGAPSSRRAAPLPGKVQNLVNAGLPPQLATMTHEAIAQWLAGNNATLNYGQKMTVQELLR